VTAIWERAQTEETAWWGDCVNTFQEETKQLDVAERLGLRAVTQHPQQRGRWPVYDLAGASVIDIGGGPVSLLLKTVGGQRLVVIDPAPYPEWVRLRYAAAGITYSPIPAEDLDATDFDEVWMYNVLQHVHDPAIVVANARAAARRVRFFDWVDTPPDDLHPHVLDPGELDRWFNGHGIVEYMAAHNAHAYYGIFE